MKRALFTSVHASTSTTIYLALALALGPVELSFARTFTSNPNPNTKLQVRVRSGVDPWVTAEELTDDRLDFGASAQDEFILGTILEARVKARVGVRVRVILGTIPRALSRMLCHCSVMCCKDSVPLCLCGVVVGPRGPWGGMGGHVGHGGPQGAMVLVLWYSAVVPSRSPDWTVVLMYGHLHS